MIIPSEWFNRSMTFEIWHLDQNFMKQKGRYSVNEY